jgi:hypothetical protein
MVRVFPKDHYVCTIEEIIGSFPRTKNYVEHLLPIREIRAE